MSLFLSSLLSTAGAYDHKRVEVNSTGSYVVPAGVTQMSVLAVGGGGGGGNAYNNSTNAYSGAFGGAGGEVVQAVIAVTPGETLTMTIGAGGAGLADATTTPAPGNSGTATTVKRGAATLVTASGGQGGATNGNSSAPYGQNQLDALNRRVSGIPQSNQTTIARPPAAVDILGYGGAGASGGYATNGLGPQPGKGGGIGPLYVVASGVAMNPITNSGGGGGGGTGYVGYGSSGSGATGTIVLDFDQPI